MLQKVTHIYRDSTGILYEDTYSVYECRHVHHKFSVNGEGPPRARRIKKNNPAMKRLKELLDDLC